MTQAKKLLREIEAPPFPGAILAIDPSGDLLQVWCGATSPITATSGDVFSALGIDDSATDAARIQLFLASCCGSVVSAFPLLAVDAPSSVRRPDGSMLSMMWQPIVHSSRIVAVAAFVTAGAPPVAQPDDPVERARVCFEALALLDECELGARHLRVDRDARHAVHRMFRAVHTIKGSTQSPQLREVSDLAHQIEDVLDALRQSETRATDETLGQLDADIARLRTAINAARPAGEVDDAMSELLVDIRPILPELRTATGALIAHDRSALGAATRVIDRVAHAVERANLRALRIQCAAARNALAMMAESTTIDPELVAQLTLLDRQMDLYAEVYRQLAATDAGPSTLATMASWVEASQDRSGEFSELSLVMSNAGITSLANALMDPDPYVTRLALAVLADANAMFEPARPRDDASLRFERAQHDLMAALERLGGDLPYARFAEVRAIAQRLVWTPLTLIARRLVRMTRTLGADLGKQVVAEIDLGDLLVAPEIGRVVSEILVHALRNATDHGIESPDDRIAADKGPTGTIRIVAREHGDRLSVIVRDDGRGIDVGAVRRRAITKGLISAERAATATDADILDLLFCPGFSTAAKVTAVSGRGVGMDVIRSLAEEQGGRVTLSSVLGFGTELDIELPFAPR